MFHHTILYVLGPNEASVLVRDCLHFYLAFAAAVPTPPDVGFYTGVPEAGGRSRVSQMQKRAEAFAFMEHARKRSLTRPRQVKRIVKHGNSTVGASIKALAAAGALASHPRADFTLSQVGSRAVRLQT
jgi:hypothetical protein